MMRNRTFSEEYLNAFVDKELDSNEISHAYDALSRDEALRTSVCSLRELKEMVRHAYSEVPSPHRSSLKKRWTPLHVQSIAACFMLLMIGGLSGWFASLLAEPKPNRDLGHLFQAISRNDSGSSPSKIMVYVGNANPVRLKTALDESENLLETYKRDHQALQVEIIANDSGVDLLREGGSRFAKRIALMESKYPNLRLVACTQTLNKLRRKGVAVQLLPNVASVYSAADEIRKRLKEGWDYVRV